MRCPLLLPALLLLATLPAEAAALAQRGQQRGRGATEQTGEGPARGRGAEEPERVVVNVERARARMTARVRWLCDELKMGPAQRKRVHDLFELELWAGTARGVEPFPGEPDLSKPIKRTSVVKITRGEIEDREGLMADSPFAAAASEQKESKRGGEGRGRSESGAEAGDAQRREPEPRSDVTSGLTPAAAAALERYRATEIELLVRTTHPMLVDLTVSTLDGVIPLLEAGQIAPYLKLLGDEGLFLVRAHAAHRISGYSMLEQGVARLKPIPTKDWSVAPRQTRRGRGGKNGGKNGGRNGGRNGGNGNGNGQGGRSRY